MNILFTVCGRAGSKGVTGKNMRQFLDVPLVWLSLAAIELYKASEEGQKHHIDMALNTDSERLIELAQQPGLALDVIRREPSLAGDMVRKVDVIRDCLLREQQRTGRTYHMVVDLDNTSPLRRVEDVARIIKRKAARPEADVVLSVTASRRSPMFNMLTPKDDGFCGVVIPSAYATRQESPAYYDINGSIYAYSPEALLHKDPAAFFHTRCDVVEMPDTGVIDIDSEEDYQLMQVIASHLYANRPDYEAIHRLASSWLPQ